MIVTAATPAGRYARTPARGRARLWAAALAVGAILPGFVSPASARVGDSAWAACVWQTAPVSAANWLGMRAPVWADNLETSSEMLGHRLIAVCSSDAADERRPNRNPNWGQLSAALRRARPDVPGTTEEQAPEVSLCRHLIASGERLATYRIDIRRGAGEGQLTVFQQYFSEHQGQAVRMPQDLRALPPAGAETRVECRAISSAGTLADA